LEKNSKNNTEVWILDIFDALKTRRSIRAYTDREIKDDDIKTIINAAMMAPSAGNARPWHFIVIKDTNTLSKIKNINPYAKMADNAKAAILICGDISLEKHPGFWVQDCSAATQNLLLAAHGLGMGSVWTGVYPIEERVKGFKELFNLPENIIPLSLSLLGYPEKIPESGSRFEEKKIHYEKWG
jgi:nitroreductase